MTITVLLVEDQPLLRLGFRMVLEVESDLRVAGEAADGAEAVRMTAAPWPDVVLMDVRMPVLDGIDATRDHHRCRRQFTRPDPDDLRSGPVRLRRPARRCQRIPVEGFPHTALLAVIRIVAGGDAALAPTTTRRLFDQFVPLLPRPERVSRSCTGLDSDRSAGTN